MIRIIFKKIRTLYFGIKNIQFSVFKCETVKIMQIGKTFYDLLFNRGFLFTFQIKKFCENLSESDFLYNVENSQLIIIVMCFS